MSSQANLCTYSETSGRDTCISVAIRNDVLKKGTVDAGRNVQHHAKVKIAQHGRDFDNRMRLLFEWSNRARVAGGDVNWSGTRKLRQCGACRSPTPTSQAGGEWHPAGNRRRRHSIQDMQRCEERPELHARRKLGERQNRIEGTRAVDPRLRVAASRSAAVEDWIEDAKNVMQQAEVREGDSAQRIDKWHMIATTSFTAPRPREESRRRRRQHMQ